MKNQFMVLILTAAAVLTVLTACQSQADPLDGTTWKLASLNGVDPISERTPTASFEDGQVSGSSGCNSYGGIYEVDGDKIAIADVTSTLMACIEPQGVMEQEAEFLSALSNAQSYRLVSGQLEVITSDGRTLIFIS